MSEAFNYEWFIDEDQILSQFPGIISPFLRLAIIIE